ncbi:MAG TPA: hypothetical protein VE218_06010 [Acidobacteriaceae bacterium]|nr:hypothetical protein [Acidobacteriaceae bacterium]
MPAACSFLRFSSSNGALADYFADRAWEAGFAGEDWAVGQYRIAPSDAPLHTKKD